MGGVDRAGTKGTKHFPPPLVAIVIFMFFHFCTNPFLNSRLAATHTQSHFSSMRRVPCLMQASNKFLAPGSRAVVIQPHGKCNSAHGDM